MLPALQVQEAPKVVEDLYRKGLGNILRRGSRVVLCLFDGAFFRCPCDFREVYIKTPPHKVEFDDAGVITITGSIGYHENPELGRKQSWCHFFIKTGRPEMCSDAECPGKGLK